jgi:ribulose-phosphate 3-epimerase
VHEEAIRGRRIAPSILAADCARLGAQVREVMDAGARVIHVDVMDGHFVPPITIGPLIVESLREQVHAAGGFLDVHLMIERPERQVQAFSDAGAYMITIHQEATPHVHYALDSIRATGCLVGLAINPGTAIEAVAGVAATIDSLFCMTVNPGWGGQAFIEASTRRVAKLRELLPDDVPIEVDGGINAGTAVPCAKAGATLFVAGSAVFGAKDPAVAYREMADAADAA